MVSSIENMKNAVNQKIARVKELAHDYAYLTGQFRRSRALKRVCSICRYEGYFRPFGSPPRKDARCPNCGALERHRLLKLWLDQHGEEIVGREVLHFAPEEAMSALFRGLACKYTSADIEEGRADTVLNIEAIELGDQTHGCIVCSHILEHVDDRKALREMRRVLRPGGIAIIMLPLVEGWSRTYENPSITTPQQRRHHFGQEDHVRYYGADVRDRIRDAGFELEEFTAEEPEVSTYALLRGEKIFTARRAS
jgi:SAM-dependent methyltransferase